MSKKFTLPKNLRALTLDPEVKKLADWYEHKLEIMENRQNKLSEKLTELYAIPKWLRWFNKSDVPIWVFIGLWFTWIIWLFS